MKTIQLQKGEVLHKIGDIASTIELIVSGRIELKSPSFNISLKKGTIIGLLENAGDSVSHTYTALEDSTLLVYPYSEISDVAQIIEEQFNNCEVIITANSSQVVSISSKYRHYKKYSDKFCQCIERHYSLYKELCNLYKLDIQAFPYAESLERYVPEQDIPDWLGDYYDQLEIMPKQIKQNFFGSHESLSIAALIEATNYSKLFLSMCNDVCSYTEDLIKRFFDSPGGDIFDLYLNLATRASKADVNASIFDDIQENVDSFIAEIGTNLLIPKDIINKRIQTYYESSSGNTTSIITEDVDKYSIIDHSLDTILKYTDLDDAEEERFRGLIKQYKALKDKNSSDDSARKLRSDITKSFFDIYEAAVIASVDSKNVPVILKMFFYFGYIDENLIGKDNALKLYEMAESLNCDGKDNVYTIYDWLASIYHGHNEPSKNEFDQDFPAYLKTQRQGGYISEEMERRYLESPKEKMRFEIMNFFKTGMKIAHGRPSAFCPILSEHNIIKPLENVLVTAQNINMGWNIIKSVDYSCFYRETLFQAPEYKISRDTIILEVMPNVILMPTLGQRSGIWQETSGVRRDTPGRMYVPIFANEDLLQMQIKLAAEFRWEMCKKIQGARWNDVSEYSLTSEYFDYLQFYRKNSDLSPDAREKVKSSLINNKNSFKNVFVSDYLLWVRYESQGSPRLNKVAKTIMFKYCPFSKAQRDKLRTNPMYTDMVIRHEAKALKTGKLLKAHYDKMKNQEGKLPPEITSYVDYFSL